MADTGEVQLRLHSQSRIPVQGAEARVRARKSKNAIMLVICIAAASLAVALLLFIIVFLLTKGIGTFSVHLFTRVPDHVDEAKGGISQSMSGSATLIFLSSLLGLPIGILGGIYQVEAKGWFASSVRFLTDVLSGIPSIVVGMFVYAVWVLPVSIRTGHPGYSAYAGAFALGLMMIPTVMRTTEEMLRLVPNTMREASLGLGATRWRTMLLVVLPAAKGGIITGIMLAIARIAGETAPLIFTVVGNEYFSTVVKQFRILGHSIHAKLPSLDGPMDALPLRIYNYSQSPSDIQHNIAWAGAVVLILLILVLSVAARLSTRNSAFEAK